MKELNSVGQAHPENTFIPSSDDMVIVAATKLVWESPQLLNLSLSEVTLSGASAIIETDEGYLSS